MPNAWKVFCQEAKYPGVWRSWHREQAVAVGWHSEWDKAFTLDGPSKDRRWGRVRSALKKMEVGDFVVAHLSGNRVGRIGEIVRKRVGDRDWDPLVPRSPAEEDGELGRRVLVRWLPEGPNDPDDVVQLPESARFKGFAARMAVCKLESSQFKAIRAAVADERNWVRVSSHSFSYEEALSDFLGSFPHELEDGLVPYPSMKVREKVFADGGRADVLLMDRSENPVIVECKQNGPTVADVRQLRRYMLKAARITGRRKVRGVLVHGGAKRLSPQVRREVARAPRIDTLRYRLALDLDKSE